MSFGFRRERERERERERVHLLTSVGEAFFPFFRSVLQASYNISNTSCFVLCGAVPLNIVDYLLEVFRQNRWTVRLATSRGNCLNETLSLWNDSSYCLVKFVGQITGEKLRSFPWTTWGCPPGKPSSFSLALTARLVASWCALVDWSASLNSGLHVMFGHAKL